MVAGAVGLIWSRMATQPRSSGSPSMAPSREKPGTRQQTMTRSISSKVPQASAMAGPSGPRTKAAAPMA